MIAVPKTLRTRVNRAAHHAALRHEMQLRDNWTAELSKAMDRKVSYDDLQAMVTRMES